MEILNSVPHLIEDVGFPVVVCIASFWIIKYSLGENHKILEELNKTILLNNQLIQLLSEKFKDK